MSSKSLVFLSISEFPSIDVSGIYTDLIREFVKNDWKVIVLYGTTDKTKVSEEVDSLVRLVPVLIREYEKTNIFRKGWAIFNFDSTYLKAIKNCQIQSVDLLLYATPPITLTRTINWVKSTFSARTYLLLKDIFPQNAVDLGLINKLNPLYLYFRFIERKLYALSDTIGCMSPANVDYVRLNNPGVIDKLEINANSIDITKITINRSVKGDVLNKYGVPVKNTIIVYGGNLGYPQGISFLLKLMHYTLERRSDIVFIVAGSGTHAYRFEQVQLDNLYFLGKLNSKEFNDLVAVSDIGLISLSERFTIPNFPSRLLSYLSNTKPVLCLVDRVTDIGKIAQEHGFGYNALHGDILECYETMTKLVDHPERRDLGNRGLEYLKKNFNTQVSYNSIVQSLS